MGARGPYLGGRPNASRAYFVEAEATSWAAVLLHRDKRLPETDCYFWME